MKNPKTGLLAAVAAAVLVGIGGDLIHTSGAQAQTVAPDAANITCASAAGNWTDCTVTLSQSIPAGGSIAAGLESRDATLAFCNDEGPSGSLCGISGNSVVFVCPSGCGAGTQLTMSALGQSTAALAQNFVLAGGTTTLDQSPAPLQLGANAAAPGR